ncbi:hypothetical protein KJ966_01925 [bacterium]|nr:hypothetical protein [bacterium]
MKSQARSLFFLFVLFFTIQSSQVKADSISWQNAQINNSTVSSALLVLLSTYIIGNVVAWIMGAYPHDYPVKPYHPAEINMISDLSGEINKYPDEVDTKVELGELYFKHNDLEKAEELLSQAIEQESENGEALVVYSANEGKLSGAMWDFTWGFMKLNRMQNAVAGLNKAIELEPDNFKIRLYRLNTLVGFRNRRGNFHRIFEDENWFSNQISLNSALFPDSVKYEFYSILSKAYSIAADQTDVEAEREEKMKKSLDYNILSESLKPAKQ